MFNNVGSKLKLSAWIVLALGVICSIVGGILCFTTAGQINSAFISINSVLGGMSRGPLPGGGLVVIGIFIILFGCVISYIGALIVHGFGQVVGNTSAIAKANGGTDQETSLHNDFQDAVSSFNNGETFHRNVNPQEPPKAPEAQQQWQPQEAPAAPAPQQWQPAPQSQDLPKELRWQTSEMPDRPAVTLEETPAVPAQDAPEAPEAAPAPQTQEGPDELSEQTREASNEAEPLVKICPECGAELDVNAAFCKKCGYKLS